MLKEMQLAMIDGVEPYPLKNPDQAQPGHRERPPSPAWVSTSEACYSLGVGDRSGFILIHR